MMKKNYYLEKNRYGFTLISSDEVFVMNESKKNNIEKKAVPYYLKRLKPTEEYMTGLFFDKKKKEYYGKTRAGQRIRIGIGMFSAEINFQ